MTPAPTRERETIASNPDRPEAASGDKHLDATGRELRDFLKESYCPEQTIALVDGWLLRDPGMSGKIIIERMQADRITRGTIEKAGKFVYGPHFELTRARESVATQEIDDLREKIGNLESHIRGVEARLASQTRELAELRTLNIRAAEDKEELRRMLNNAEAEVIRLKDLATKQPETPAASAAK